MRPPTTEQQPSPPLLTITSTAHRIHNNDNTHQPRTLNIATHPIKTQTQALEAGKTAKLPRVYYSFEDQLKTNPSGNVPYTPSLMLLHGLKESLAMLREEGMANVVARHHRLAEGTRRAVDAWGLKLLCKQPRWRSDSLTVIEVPEGVDSNLIVKNAYAR